MYPKISKFDAVAYIGRRYGGNLLGYDCVIFANINKSVNVWWMDIPIDKFARDTEKIIHFLLFDHRSADLHHLCVPTAYLRDQEKNFQQRPDKGAISLELSCDRPRLFQDRRSGIGFGQFLQPTSMRLTDSKSEERLMPRGSGLAQAAAAAASRR